MRIWVVWVCSIDVERLCLARSDLLDSRAIGNLQIGHRRGEGAYLESSRQ